MAKRREIGNKPAGKNDELNLTYTQFAANKERSEIRIDEGFGFENDALLKSFGFELDNSGTLTMKAVDNDKIHIEEKDNTIERVVGGKVASSVKVSKTKINRMIEREKEKDNVISNTESIKKVTQTAKEKQNESVIIDTPAIAQAMNNTRRKARASKSSDTERE